MAASKSEQSESEARDKLKQIKFNSALKALSDLDTEQVEEIVLGGEQELSERDPEERGGIVHIQTIANKIDQAYDKWGKVSGISTGYPSLDAKIGGLKKGELLLIGGETNNGKSAVAANIAVNVSREHGVLYISLEMLQEEIGSRVKYMNGGTLEGLDLMFQEEYTIDYRHIQPLFEKATAFGQVKLVVLDYLQYLGRGMTLDEVAKMSQLLKKSALRYQVPFIVIVSLRKGDGGKFKRKWTDIEVEDLMGTSAIGYDADVAMVVSRKDTENQYDPEHVWLKIIKSRNMPLDYNDRYIRFDWDKTKITESMVPYGVEVIDGDVPTPQYKN